MHAWRQGAQLKYQTFSTCFNTEISPSKVPIPGRKRIKCPCRDILEVTGQQTLPHVYTLSRYLVYTGNQLHLRRVVRGVTELNYIS